ncbi:hypothetical protein A2574_01410 [Candidatus Shapirobacteria bacterium RIFOXYD1_FULL_38_32]|uniref:Uncharacterized protein n=2 Tax=Candidatus Shapironibacteriota TaxID=1752721 RepID=A0A0G0K3Y4_9BACT|nr:MAG: hypothetical protein US90_C0008G0027 [Candidatus Shapirobacteria bacterium GW2011_GWE2_38_30]OGL56401.1 MAG: hypothetical protein A2367_01375 [Candidatus Shapirobacteria bacterium RIFOXYB1_FULL_38_38]OGL56578.1 MAG: hypothetical protein A2195_00725 [Candidatus Shapirobacteria bacterium RIFOXYA1_FULL_39_17]OGL57769.1 MAG: hypothetical protein A2410_00570 [Candidatus Shapirobacteria bacterium RIFOXYC1_FULL_38_24]OGL58164.1 MAG: hypothetical protein A2574_01410 [Candidatus Shapirobacteria 
MANNFLESELDEITDEACCIVHNRPDSEILGVEGCRHRREGVGVNADFFYCDGPARDGDFNKCPEVRGAAGRYEGLLPLNGRQ